MPTETEQTSTTIKIQHLSSRRVTRERGCNRRVYDTAETVIANRYWVQVALSTKMAEVSQAAVPSRGGVPARLPPQVGGRRGVHISRQGTRPFDRCLLRQPIMNDKCVP